MLFLQHLDEPAEHPWLHEDVVVEKEDGIRARLPQKVVALLGNALPLCPIVPLDAVSARLEHAGEGCNDRLMPGRTLALVRNKHAKISNLLRSQAAKRHD